MVSKRNGKTPLLRSVMAHFATMFAMLLICGTVPAQVLAAVFFVPPDDELSSDNLLPFVTYLEDPTRSLEFDEVRELFGRGAGKVWPEPLFNAGFSDSSWWFRFRIENRYDQQRQLFVEIDYPLLDTVDAYCNTKGGRYALSRMGDHVQFDTRDLIVRNHVIPLLVAAQSGRECFVRVESSSNVAFPVTVSDLRPFMETSRNGDWRLGVFYGIAFALLIYNLLVFLASRERLYLFYVLHVFASACYNSLLDGSWGSVWSAVGMPDYWLMLFIIGSQAAALMFAREYLDYRDPFHPASRLISVALFVLVAEALALPFVELPLIARVILYTTLMVSLLVLTLGLLRLRENPRTAIPFVLGFGAVVTMAIGASLASLGWFSSVVITTYGMKWAWAFELAMLSTGLGLRIEDMKRRQFDADLDHAENDARAQARTMVLSSMYDTLREPVDALVDLGNRLAEAPLQGRDKRQLQSLQVASLLVAEHLAHMEGAPVVAGEPEAAFDWWVLTSGCAGMFAPRFKSMGVAVSLSVTAGTPREVITRQGALRVVTHEILSKVAPSLMSSGMSVQLGLTDDIHDERLWLKMTVDAPPGTSRRPLPPRVQLSTQGQACLAVLGARVGWSNPGSGSGAWLLVPVSVPDDVDSAARDWCLDLQGDDAVIDHPVVGHETVHDVPEPVPTRADTSSPEKEPMPSRPVPRGLRVLLAEDNLINQKVILGFLERLGAEVKTVPDGRQAVACVQATENRFDLVLMDCQMPVMNGFDAMRAIRAWEQAEGWPAVPAIGLSAHSGEEWRQQGQDAGLDLYLTKPLTFRGVSEAIKRVLAPSA